jgi:DMATS type aromatic prenyltransferase
MSGATQRREEGAQSYLSLGSERLSALCRASSLAKREPEILGIFATLVAPWGERPAPSAPPWASDVCDDNTPFEFSLVFSGGEPELRMLVEAQGDEPTHAAYWKAGRALTERLAREFPVSLERVKLIEDLFEPTATAKLAVWHAVSFWPSRAPEFKLYFDAQADGLGRASGKMEEALCRLGFRNAWSRMNSALLRGNEVDEPKYVSLDLASSPKARIKLYVRHHAATSAVIDTVMAGDGALPAGEAAAFCRAMAGGDGPYVARPLFSCTTLVSEMGESPAARTLYVPLGAYAREDATAAQRITEYLNRHSLPAESYKASLGAFAQRDLKAGVGMHSYASLRLEGGKRRVTVYLSPELHRVDPPIEKRSGTYIRARIDPPPPAPSIVHRYEQEITLAEQPFFQRMAREPVNLSHLWLVLANFWEAIVHDFPSRLAKVVAKIESDEVRSVVVKQLNDELGEGDFSKAHKAMFRRLVDAVVPHRLPGDDATLLAPGREFGRKLGVLLFDPDDYVTLGALMMIEVYGAQTDVRLGTEFRRQMQIDGDSLQWLHLHETLEVDHAGDSLRLANLVPPGGAALEATWRGAYGVVAAAQEYFNALYAICYP